MLSAIRRFKPSIAVMKRKLNESDVPTAVKTSNGDHETTTNFSTMGLDSRLLQATAKENFSRPTLVQAKAIPLALEGKDVLGKRRPTYN